MIFETPHEDISFSDREKNRRDCSGSGNFFIWGRFYGRKLFRRPLICQWQWV